MEECDEEKWRVGLWLALAMDGSQSLGASNGAERATILQACQGRRRSPGKTKSGLGTQSGNGPRLARRVTMIPQAVGPQMWLTMIWHHGSEPPLVLEDWTLLFQRAGPCAGDAGAADIPGKHAVLWRCGFRGLRLLARDPSTGSPLSGSSRRQCPTAETTWATFANMRGSFTVGRMPLRRRNSRRWYCVCCTFRTGVEMSTWLRVSSTKRHSRMRQASEIYRRRWGIEVQFRSFKQTFQRSKLRSRSPECAEIELHWSLAWALDDPTTGHQGANTTGRSRRTHQRGHGNTHHPSPEFRDETHSVVRCWH